MIARAAFAAAVLFLAWQASDVLFLVFGAVLFACALSGAADWVAAKTRWKRGLALAAVVVLVAAAFVGALFFVGPRLVSQAEQLWQTLPSAAGDLLARLHLDTSWSSWSWTHGMIGKAAGVFSTVLTAATGIFLAGVLTIYLAAQPKLYRDGLLSLIAPRRRERLGSVMDEIGETLQHWLLGKLVLMGFVALATGIGLELFGVPLAITLALIAGVGDFVPNLGPLLAAVPAVLIAAMRNPMDAVWVALLYWGVQIAENNVLTPLVQRRAVDLPPALIIFSQALLGTLFGLPGLLFATPIAAVARIAVKRLYVEDVVEAG